MANKMRSSTALSEATFLTFDPQRLPRSLYLLLENALQAADTPEAYLAAFADWLDGKPTEQPIPFFPTRLLMQDTAGVCALADLAALRDYAATQGAAPEQIDSLVPIDLIIDHSISMDVTGSPSAFEENTRREFARNGERYSFFKWSLSAFQNLTIYPPGEGICHQINLERIALPVQKDVAPLRGQSVVGTDSHTTMVNALGVLGWGVGGMEAEAVALGEPLMIQLPPVLHVKLVGRPQAGVSATDIALEITRLLREAGVVGHFVEFDGPGLTHLSLPDRAAIANMAPEYGATCGLFPIDEVTLQHLRFTRRTTEDIELIRAYARDTGLWAGSDDDRVYTRRLEIDLSAIQLQMAGPRRPQDTVALPAVPASLKANWPSASFETEAGKLGPGAIAIAAITSCTHTANPALMIAAGLVARKANALGLRPPAWVKTSIAPGSHLIAELLERLGLQDDLDALGFHVAGFGCGTCVGNSGELAPETENLLRSNGGPVCAVLSGNRNFERRIHPDITAAYIASPALVVVSALAGNLSIELTSEPLGFARGKSIYFADIWPTDAEIAAEMARHASSTSSNSRDLSVARRFWDALAAPSTPSFPWNSDSHYVKQPPFFHADKSSALADIHEAVPLLVLGDSITTDHISPIGRIAPGSPAAQHLEAIGVGADTWGSYGERRANHEIMARGTFAHQSLKNRLSDRDGPWAVGAEGNIASVFDAAQSHLAQCKPLVVFAGDQYGTGSARDWAAKGTSLLGVRAVLASSFERIHRSNLVGAGVLAIQLPAEFDPSVLTTLTQVDILGLEAIDGLHPHVTLCIQNDSESHEFQATCIIETMRELEWLRAGSIFHYVRDRLPGLCKQ